MLKTSIVLFFTLLAVAQCGNLAAETAKRTNNLMRSLYNQAKEKLKELEKVIESAILAAHTKLAITLSNYENYAQDVESKAEIEIQNEAEKIGGYISDIKELAAVAQVNIQVCLHGKESELQMLPQKTLQQLQTCVRNVSDHVTNKISETGKSVDNNMDTVKVLDAQLLKCTNGSIICVSPVLREIDSAMIEVPENIEKKVQVADGLISTLTLEIDECKSSHISMYVTKANSLLGAIEDCVNKLL